ncbi:MAG: helix-turn-helix domain-containing protein [Elainellaceae cyanobacterium]
MDYTDQLQHQMARAGLESIKALCEAAQVSSSSVRRLRSGHLSQMQLKTLLKLSQALDLTLVDLIQQFSEGVDGDGLEHPQARDGAAIASRESPQQDSYRFQRLSLQKLESWLLQWPTAADAVQKAAAQNRQIPASRLIPLVKPVVQLTQAWGVVPLGKVGQEVAYDPQIHQLMAGQAVPGELVYVRYVGYYHGDALLHRAKVSPLPPKVRD